MEVIGGSIGLNVVIAGVGQIFTICVRIYEKYEAVKRYKEDCAKLVGFVQRVQIVLDSTRAAADLEDLRWKSAFDALYTSLKEVETIFDDCAKGGMILSLILADDMNMRLSSISQRLQLALSMIPIQKANVAEEKLVELKQLQSDLLRAQWSATRAAEEQAAMLKRLADQSAVDASKSHQMLAEILTLLKSDAAGCKPPGAIVAAPAPGAMGGVQPCAFGGVQHEQLESEREELRKYKARLHSEKHFHEEHYLEHIIKLIDRLEAAEAFEAPAETPPTPDSAAASSSSAAAAAAAAGASSSSSTTTCSPSRKLTRKMSVSVPPHELMCPITLQLFRDPVLLVGSGYTYEREAIQEWLSRGSKKDPATGVQLMDVTLAPNINIRKQAQDWLERNTWYKTVLEQDRQLLRMRSSKKHLQMGAEAILISSTSSTSSTSSSGSTGGGAGSSSCAGGGNTSGSCGSRSLGNSGSSSKFATLPSVFEEQERSFSSSGSGSSRKQEPQKKSAVGLFQQMLRLNLSTGQPTAPADAPAADAAGAAADTAAEADQLPSSSTAVAAGAGAAGAGMAAQQLDSLPSLGLVKPCMPMVIDFGSASLELPSKTLSGGLSGSEGKLPKLPPVFEDSTTQQAKQEAQLAYAASVSREAAAAAARGSNCVTAAWVRGQPGPRPCAGPYGIPAAQGAQGAQGAAPVAAAPAVAGVSGELESAFVLAAAQSALSSESSVLPPVMCGRGTSPRPCIILDQYSAQHYASD